MKRILTLGLLALLPFAGNAQRLEQPAANKTSPKTQVSAPSSIDASAFLFGDLELSKVSPKKNGKVTDSMLNLASTRLGTPYRSGGSSAKGFDCSGFVGYVYSNFGVSLPRNSGSISQMGLEISPDNAKKGDIIYFSGRGGGKRVGHVGIVSEIRDGVIHFIHSASSKGVTYSTTQENYYKARVLGIRRVIK